MDTLPLNGVEDAHSNVDTGGSSRRRSNREVKLELDTSKNDSGSSQVSNERQRMEESELKDKESPPSNLRKHITKLRTRLSSDLLWIPSNNNWSKWKPVIRCALAAWISGILFIIPKTETAMGQVCYVIFFSHSRFDLGVLYRQAFLYL